MVAARVCAGLLGGGAARMGRKGWSKALAWPWLVFGSNAIVAYMISEELYVRLVQVRFTDDGQP